MKIGNYSENIVSCVFVLATKMEKKQKDIVILYHFLKSIKLIMRNSSGLPGFPEESRGEQEGAEGAEGSRRGQKGVEESRREQRGAEASKASRSKQ